MRTSQAGIELIRSFEGCVLTAYKCASGIWTVGVGHTGPDVTPGLTITQARADELLVQDLQRFEQAVDRLITCELWQSAFDATVSFAFNVGEGALAESTYRRRLNAGEDRCTVAREELPKWVNGSSGPLPGLVRRRDAEVALFCSGETSSAAPTPPAPAPSEGLKALRDTVLKKFPIPSDALAAGYKTAIGKDTVYPVFQVLKEQDGHRLVELPWGMGQWWAFVDHFTGWQGEATSAPPAPELPSADNHMRLAVPYQSQRNNYRDASRTCFSSSCAMLLMFLKPGVINSDDDYIREVFKRGDSTDASVQVATLAHFGLPVTYHQNGTLEGLKAQLRAGKPIPIGILHKGPSSAPSGGGHWITAIGFRDDASKPGGGTFICHDPWGELDNASGNYVSTNGAALEYSYKMISQRYTVANPQDGWYIKA